MTASSKQAIHRISAHLNDNTTSRISAIASASAMSNVVQVVIVVASKNSRQLGG
jgi:hypothetical protein